MPFPAIVGSLIRLYKLHWPYKASKTPNLSCHINIFLSSDNLEQNIATDTKSGFGVRRARLFIGTTRFWLSDKNGILMVQIDRMQVTDQCCNLITIGFTRSVENDISSDYWTFEIQIVGNSQHPWYNLNMLIVWSVSSSHIPVSSYPKVTRAAFSALTGWCVNRNLRQ